MGGQFSLDKKVTLQAGSTVFTTKPQNVKRMLLLDYPYPAVMDKEVAQNREGVNSKD